MSNILEQENTVVKELFNFTGDQSQLSGILDSFSNLIKQINDLRHSLILLNHYCKTRPYQRKFARQFMDCIYNSFPDSDEIIHDIILKDKIPLLALSEVLNSYTLENTT